MPKFVAGAGGSMLIEWITAGGTANLHGDYRTCEITRAGDTAESTAGTIQDKEFIATTRGFNVSCEIVHNGTVAPTTVANLQTYILPLVSGTIRVSPLGTATNAVKYTGAAICTTVDASFPYDDVATLSIEFQGTGALAVTAY